MTLFKQLYEIHFLFFKIFISFVTFRTLTFVQPILTLYHTVLTFKDPKKAFENIVGKGENAGNQHFLIFPQYFLPFSKQVLICQSNLFFHLQILSIWTILKCCHLVKS